MKGITKSLTRLILGIALIAAPAVVVGDGSKIKGPKKDTHKPKHPGGMMVKGGYSDAERQAMDLKTEPVVWYKTHRQIFDADNCPAGEDAQADLRPIDPKI